MKHTPEEQLQFIKDNDLKDDFFNAIQNNDKGIGYMPVTIQDVLWEDGQTKVVIQLISGNVMAVPCEKMKAEDDRRLLRNAVRDNRILAGMICYLSQDDQADDDDYLVFTIDEKHSSEEELWEQLSDQVFLDVIQHCGFDSHGKIRVFIERGKEILDSLM